MKRKYSVVSMVSTESRWFSQEPLGLPQSREEGVPFVELQ